MKQAKLLTACLVAMLAVAITAVADNTRRRGIKVKKEVVEAIDVRPVPVVSDTVAVDTADIVMSGYDKPLRTHLESLLVTNRMNRCITSLLIHIVYRDMVGRQLHRVDRWVKCSIPGGETRMVSFSSWDRQQSFYYKNSRPPMRSSGTPYDIAASIDRVILLRE